MSKKQIEECIRVSLDGYFKDLRGTEPDRMYEMMVQAVERKTANQTVVIGQRHAELGLNTGAAFCKDCKASLDRLKNCCPQPKAKP